MLGLNFKAAFMLPLIFILPCTDQLETSESETYLHESILWVELSVDEGVEVIIQHHEGAVKLKTLNLAFFDSAFAVLQVNGEHGWLVVLVFSDFECVNASYLLDHVLSVLGKLSGHFFEEVCCLQGHD